VSFSEHLMTGPAHGMVVSYAQQEDVDAAFADYDRALLTLHPRPAYAARTSIICVSCGAADFTFNNTGSNEPGARVCNRCGVVQPGCIIYEQMFGRRMPPRTSNYKRIHHWHERISQLMLMESQIPTEHMLAIGERILDGTTTALSKDTIRAVLRSLGLQVYIEKWLQIIERCTGVLPPCPGPVVLSKLDDLFLQLQRPFDACKLKGRRNFLNYNYVFCRLFQRMGCTKFCMFFPLIRSKVKLRALDDMWSAMVTSLGWDDPPLEQVVPFCVRIVESGPLLHRLRMKCAETAPPEPASIRLGTAPRKWDRQPVEWRPPVRSERHSVRSEPVPHTLALRLKRKRNMQASPPRSASQTQHRQ
jgi:hypothetical protein